LAGPDGSKSDNFDYDVTFVDFKKNTISLPLPPLEAGAITQSFQATMLILPGHKPLRFAFVDSGGGLVRMHPTRELAPSLMR
jgi:hypothetical protein